jgi:hypothetical protein
MGSERLPITLFFNLLNADTLRFIHHRGFGTNAGFKLVDHVAIIQTIFTNTIFIETTFLVTAGHAQRDTSASPGPFTTQPMDIHRGDNVFQTLLQGIHVPITSNS